MSLGKPHVRLLRACFMFRAYTQKRRVASLVSMLCLTGTGLQLRWGCQDFSWMPETSTFMALVTDSLVVVMMWCYKWLTLCGPMRLEETLLCEGQNEWMNEWMDEWMRLLRAHLKQRYDMTKIFTPAPLTGVTDVSHQTRFFNHSCCCIVIHSIKVTIIARLHQPCIKRLTIHPKIP